MHRSVTHFQGSAAFVYVEQRNVYSNCLELIIAKRQKASRVYDVRSKVCHIDTTGYC